MHLNCSWLGPVYPVEPWSPSCSSEWHWVPVTSKETHPLSGSRTLPSLGDGPARPRSHCPHLTLQGPPGKLGHKAGPACPSQFPESTRTRGGEARGAAPPSPGLMQQCWLSCLLHTQSPSLQYPQPRVVLQ